jgi:hypothetical protein
LQTAAPTSDGEHSFGPATLDRANRYLSWLSKDHACGRVPEADVRTRVARLARVSSDLAASWNGAT